MIHHMRSSENEVPWNPMVCDIIFSLQWTILVFFMWEKQCHKPLDHPPSSPQSPFLFIGGIVWLNRWPFPVMAADCRQIRHGGGLAKLPTQQPNHPQVQGKFGNRPCASFYIGYDFICNRIQILQNLCWIVWAMEQQLSSSRWMC